MRIGVVFPQTEIGPEADVVREYAQVAEASGYEHLLVYDHVVGADTTDRPDWRGPYRLSHQFHEPFVLFGFLSGFTQTIEMVTGVIILPQRQTALVAKQAAEVDRLSGGRLRLGVGIGWNQVEYEVLNERFDNRGKRLEEQIDVMRAFWTDESVDFHGRYHTVPKAGINPMPIQRPIPVWIGGYADAVMERIGRMADGWFPGGQPGDELQQSLDLIARSADAAGRDAASIGMEGRISLHQGEESVWVEQTEAWRKAGASHLSVNTMGVGRNPAEHIEAIRRYREVLGQ